MSSNEPGLKFCLPALARVHLGGSDGVPVLVPVRKKTDKQREGWEDGTPPPRRDFKCAPATTYFFSPRFCAPMLLAALPVLAACSALRPSFRQPSAPTRRHAVIFASEGDKLETERAAVEVRSRCHPAAVAVTTHWLQLSGTARGSPRPACLV